ncbi:MAG: copper chaperone PCu(A)C [Litorilinea sp.]
MSRYAHTLLKRGATPIHAVIIPQNRKRPWRWRMAALGLLLLLSACTAPWSQSPTPIPPVLPTPVPNAVTIVAALARPAPLVGGNGAIYLTLTNGRDVPVQLVSAASSAAATVEIHETVADNGIMRMQHLPDGVTIPPQGNVQFQPGGLHLMLINLGEALTVGESIELTLHLESNAAGTPVRETLVATVMVGEPDRDASGNAGEDSAEAHDH